MTYDMSITSQWDDGYQFIRIVVTDNDFVKDSHWNVRFRIRDDLPEFKWKFIARSVEFARYMDLISVIGGFEQPIKHDDVSPDIMTRAGMEEI